uniref:NADH dehydrogenase subunit 2 n=1 Tax=Busonia albilateralis TaxID=2479888 RepID=UPI002411137C|nr:NADH dehydrogenase subunit 2 [Busonia albilateralis]WEP24810.1 NADH dehydrogenase subunit 2 [Busonia albilateralis]
MLNSTLILFNFMIFGGLFISVCSNNWIIIWMGMEITTLSFITLLKSNSFISSESAMKYFIIQSVSSSLFILAIMFMLMGVNMNMNVNMIICFSMFMKMGVAPFHNWLLNMVEGVNYYMLSYMLTLMKVVPLMISMMFDLNFNLIVVLNLFIGSICGLNQNSFRKIISYSSVFNMSFMIYSKSNFIIWMNYLVIYSFMIISLIFILNKYCIYYLNQMVFNQLNLINKLSLWLLIVSLGGIPPTMGFFIKMKVIELGVYMGDMFLIFFMVMMSLLVMFYYNRICFISICLNYLMPKWNMMMINQFSLLIIFFSFYSMPFLFMFKIFI